MNLGVISVQGFFIFQSNITQVWVMAMHLFCMHCFCLKMEIIPHHWDFIACGVWYLCFRNHVNMFESCPVLCLYLHMPCLSPRPLYGTRPPSEHFLSTPFSFYPPSLCSRLSALLLAPTWVLPASLKKRILLFWRFCEALFYILDHPQFGHDGGERPSSVLLWCGAQPGTR